MANNNPKGSGLAFWDFLVAFLVASSGAVVAFLVVGFAVIRLDARQAMVVQMPDASQAVQDVQNVTPPVAQVAVPNFSERQRAAEQQSRSSSVMQPVQGQAEEPVQQDITPEATPSQPTAPSQTQTPTPSAPTQQTPATTPSGGQAQNNGSGIALNPAAPSTQTKAPTPPIVKQENQNSGGRPTVYGTPTGKRYH